MSELTLELNNNSNSDIGTLYLKSGEEIRLHRITFEWFSGMLEGIYYKIPLYEKIKVLKLDAKKNISIDVTHMALEFRDRTGTISFD